MNVDAELRKQLVKLLEGGQAHLTFASAMSDFAWEDAGTRPAGAPHSAWQLLEHLRITQRDILEFSQGRDYRPIAWPDDYWPKTERPESQNAWAASMEAFEADLESMKELAKNPTHDLYKPLPHGDGQNLLREILLVADHNSHHLGQLIYLKKMLVGKDRS